MQALAKDGTVLYTIHEGTGGRWIAPKAASVPERVTEQAELPLEASGSIGIPAPVSSLWRNGEVQIDGQWQPFYVWADGREELCGIGTVVDGRGAPWYQEYACPEPLGALEIRHIDETGRIVFFEAPDGKTGNLDLETLNWEIHPDS